MPNQYLSPVIQIPSSLLITAITQTLPMIITVEVGNSASQANTYVAGMSVKLSVPVSYKMFQADGLIGTIININGNNFTLNIDSSFFDAFVIPLNSKSITPASIAPYGSSNYQYSNTSRPVPFQSLNNGGN
jgi:hypothetical protein